MSSWNFPQITNGGLSGNAPASEQEQQQQQEQQQPLSHLPADELEGDITRFSERELTWLRASTASAQSFVPLPGHSATTLLSSNQESSLYSPQLELRPGSTYSDPSYAIDPRLFSTLPSEHTSPLLSTPSSSSVNRPPSWGLDHARLPSQQSFQGQSSSLPQSPRLVDHDVFGTMAGQRHASSPSLPRRRSRYLRSSAGSRSIPIPRNSQGSSPNGHSQDPMQRWRDSPPEAEGASLSAILSAVQRQPSISTSHHHHSGASSVVSASHSLVSRTASIKSFDSGTSYSAGSATSARSAGSRRPSFSRNSQRNPSRSSRQQSGTGRRNGRSLKGGDPKERRRFPCTFCTDSFPKKHDWVWHERSLHLNLERWVCAPLGGSVVSPETGRAHCAFCNILDPTSEHLQMHNYANCQADGKSRAEFNRKDHLVQHLRLVHHIETLPIIDGWRSEAPPIRSRCGICGIVNQTWQERADHLAHHFRNGKTMSDWTGGHEFEPHIEALVTNAMPPYILELEAKAPIPFSATSKDTRDHLVQIRKAAADSAGMWNQSHSQLQLQLQSQPQPQPQPQTPSEESIQSGPGNTSGGGPDMNDDAPGMTYAEILAVHLAQYARQHMSQGVVPTDEMFREEARTMIYESKDEWDYTVADDAGWLSNFRRRHLGNTRDGS